MTLRLLVEGMFFQSSEQIVVASKEKMSANIFKLA